MVLGILAILIGGAFCFLPANYIVVKILPQLRAARRGRSTQGRVVAIRAQHLKGGGQFSHDANLRTADIHFRAEDGQSVTYPQVLEMGREFRRGDTVTVHYNPADAAGSATIDAPYDLRTSLMFNSGLVILFGAAFVYGVLIVLGVVSSSSTG